MVYLHTRKNLDKVTRVILVVIIVAICIGRPNSINAGELDDDYGDLITAGFVILSAVPCVVVSVANLHAIEDEGSYFWGSTGVLLGVPVAVGGIWAIYALDEEEDTSLGDNSFRFVGIPVSIIGALTTAAGIKSIHTAFKSERKPETGFVVDPIIIPEKNGEIGFGIQISRSF